ncbi:hypothetical protein FRC11_004676 [Ceratobasidium sp. 423]|nr:hypothetical protein FRC11_004676 [Ceratobasidium sp. 423]
MSRLLEYTQRSLHDLAFIVPPNFSPNFPPPKFMLFMKSKLLCERAAEFLRQRLPKGLQDKIVWVHADMTRKFNEQALTNLRDGRIYGIVCTDVAGMGIDILDIGLVVLYQVPSKFCTVTQRNGRGARNPAHSATAVLIAEPKYFDDTKKDNEVRAEKRRANAAQKRKVNEDRPLNEVPKRRRPNQPPVVKIEDPEPDPNILLAQPEPLSVAQRKKKQHEIEPVMDAFINAPLRHWGDKSACCRKASDEFFGNPPHIKETPPAPSRAPRASTLTTEELEKWTDKDQELLEALEAWCEEVCQTRWGGNHFIGGFGILPDAYIDRLVRLARHGVLVDRASLQREIKWNYHDEHGDNVLKVIHSVYPPGSSQKSASQLLITSGSQSTPQTPV